jgi:hypothetical protein
MAPKLCASCRHLPSTLFQAEHDEQELTGGPEIYLPPLYILRQNAADGCMLCAIWTTKPSVKYLPEPLLRYRQTRLRRSQIAPHMSVTAYIDADDIFVVYFSRIPYVWGEPSHHSVLRRLNANADHTDILTGRGGDSFEGLLNRSWLDICRSQHPACNKALECIKDGPSRLLDLQAFDNSGDIRLVDCKTWTETPQVSTFPTFVCLSHCWGEPSVRPKMTRKSTLLQHLERISLVELSRTFQDAIRITRQLQERYLWIDSLCIIQDDPQDWETEAARMPAIYGSATLTIAAFDAENGNGGCNVNPKPVEFVDVDTESLQLRFPNTRHHICIQCMATTSINTMVMVPCHCVLVLGPCRKDFSLTVAFIMPTVSCFGNARPPKLRAYCLGAIMILPTTSYHGPSWSQLMRVTHQTGRWYPGLHGSGSSKIIVADS